MNGNIFISILVITYNQEAFISEALDSILMQKVNFDYEIVVGDDCSTDNTRGILLDYKSRYSDKIKLIMRNENLGLMGNYVETLSECTGKYIAVLAGDDYWTDPNKLQSQVDILEIHDSCSFACHDLDVVQFDKKFIRKHSQGRINEHWNTGEVLNKEILSSPWMVPHPCSIMFKKEYLDLRYLRSLGKISGEDYPTIVMLCNYGNGYYINKSMGIYRQSKKSISASRSYANNENLINEIINTHHFMNNYFDEKFNKEIKIHLKNQLMNKYEEELNIAIEQGNILNIVKSFIIMLCKCHDSKYSFLDVGWLLKDKLKTKFINE